MLCTAQTQIPRHAPVDRFQLLRGRLLTGNRLRDVKALQDSIIRFGLLSPIVAIDRAGHFIVVDGRKRIAAIRRLAFEDRLPRSLTHIPYLLTDEMTAAERRVPILVSNRDLFAALLKQFHDGASVTEMADRFCISHQCVRDILSLSRLDPAVRAAFFRRVINFSQARAYAALPDRRAQVARLRELGLFATPKQILEETSRAEAEADLVAA